MQGTKTHQANIRFHKELNIPGITGEIPQEDIQFSTHPSLGWLLLVFLPVQFYYQVFYSKKLQMALNACSSEKIQVRRTKGSVNILHSSLLSQSLFIAQPLTRASKLL